MSNPFEQNFDGECPMCDGVVYAGDNMYCHEGEFMCEFCVPDENVCSCGNYKKENFGSCYECFDPKKKEIIVPPKW